MTCRSFAISPITHGHAAGEVVELGTVREVFDTPRQAYTRALLAASLSPDPDAKAGHLASVPAEAADTLIPKRSR